MTDPIYNRLEEIIEARVPTLRSFKGYEFLRKRDQFIDYVVTYSEGLPGFMDIEDTILPLLESEVQTLLVNAIAYHPSSARYVALFIDNERKAPIWKTSCYSGLVERSLYDQILEVFDKVSMYSEDEYWLILDTEANPTTAESFGCEEGHRILEAS